MSNPQENNPDKTAKPQQEQGNPPNKPDQQGDGVKKADALGDVGDNKMNLASKSDSNQGWKGIG